jgi:hypothetical protein
MFLVFSLNLEARIWYIHWGLGATGSPSPNLGAIKHGRWNGDSAPDLCVMRVPPVYINL